MEPKSSNVNNAQQPLLASSTHAAGSRTSTHASTLRIPQSSFSRSFSRPLPPPNTRTSLKPPATLDVNRGSVTSIYSQASIAERPASITSISITRKQPSRQRQSSHLQDLTSVDEEGQSSPHKSQSPPIHDEIDGNNHYTARPPVTPRRHSLEDEDKPLVSPITRSNSQWSRGPVSPEQSVRNLRLSRSNTAVSALSRMVASDVDVPPIPAVNPASHPYDKPRPVLDRSFGSASSQDDSRAFGGREDSDHMLTVPLCEPDDQGERQVTQESPLTTRSISVHSTNPLLDSPSDQSKPTIRDGIPSQKRSANLNLNVVKERQSRGSLTSLPDLIQRAARLASNLDRGRTASRLGLDAFLFNDKSVTKRRESTYSDVLFSFPAPAATTPTTPSPESRSASRNAEDKETVRATSRLMEIKDVDDEEMNEKSVEEPKPSQRRRRKRSKRAKRYCGLPLKIFILLLVLSVLMVATAVLLPIFLIWMPNRRAAGTISGCAASASCKNGGIGVIDNGACACICVNGYTGNQCTIAGDPSCITSTFKDGNVTYQKATIGSNLLPLLSTASVVFNIPLNTTTLLSVFSRNNLSCSAENALIRFSADSSSKRSILIPGLGLSLPTKVTYKIPTKRNPDSPPAETENGVIYAATSTAAGPAGPATTANPTTPSSAPAATSTIKATSEQLNFAEVVVLYVLQQLRNPSLAVNAQQTLDQYLKSGGTVSGNSTVKVVPYADSQIIADFGKFTVTNVDGHVVGGKTTSA